MICAVASETFCWRATEWPRNTSYWFSPEATWPSFSEKPQRVTIARASLVAWSMSDAAPEVMFSLPNLISSATRPPIMMASREIMYL